MAETTIAGLTLENSDLRQTLTATEKLRQQATTHELQLLRDLAASRAEAARMRDVLERLLGWDHLEGAADGPYWRKAIRAALEPSQ